MIALNVNFLVLIAGFSSVLADHWKYGDETHWPGFCQKGKLQSPIDFDLSNTVVMMYGPMQFTNYDLPQKAKVKNNGHSVAITLQTSGNSTPMISNGGFMHDYLLDHIHFHWQSEHTVGGYRYPLEMHLVHYAQKYGSVAEAQKHENGLAVLGVLFDISLDDDRDFIPLIEVMRQVVEQPNKEVELVRELRAMSFIPRDTGEYFRYQGSLTTPTCDEVVIWTVFTKPITISADQILHFESVWSDDGPLKLNYRPVQPVNDRQILVRGTPTFRGAAAPGLPSLSILTTSIFAFIAAKLF